MAELFYEFGVFSTKREIMVFQTRGSDKNDFFDYGYAFPLYEKELNPESDYLMIYFPNERMVG